MDEQTVFDLPELRGITVINQGDYNVAVNFDADIDADSVIVPVGAVADFPFRPLDIRLKCATNETATVQIYGLRNEKI